MVAPTPSPLKPNGILYNRVQLIPPAAGWCGVQRQEYTEYLGIEHSAATWRLSPRKGLKPLQVQFKGIYISNQLSRCRLILLFSFLLQRVNIKSAWQPLSCSNLLKGKVAGHFVVVADVSQLGRQVGVDADLGLPFGMEDGTSRGKTAAGMVALKVKNPPGIAGWI